MRHLLPNLADFFNFSMSCSGDMSLRTIAIIWSTFSPPVSLSSTPALPSLLTPVPHLAPLCPPPLLSPETPLCGPAPTSVPADAPQVGKNSSCSKHSPASAVHPASCLSSGQGALGTTNETGGILAPQERRVRSWRCGYTHVFLHSYGVMNAQRNTHPHGHPNTQMLALAP